jgi:gluconolactonase
VICIDRDGREIIRINGDGTGPFLFPNDLCFGSGGYLYLTDSGMRVEDVLDGQSFDCRRLPWDGRST